MPITENVFFKDENSVNFVFEFKWPKVDFRPRRGLSAAIQLQAVEARHVIEKEVEAFIFHGKDAVPTAVDLPPDSATHMTGRVFVSIASGLGGSGGPNHVKKLAGEDAYKRVKSLLEAQIIEGYEPWAGGKA